MTVPNFRIFEQYFIKKKEDYGCIIKGCDHISAISENSPFWKLHSIVNGTSIASKFCTVVDMSSHYLLQFVS